MLHIKKNLSLALLILCFSIQAGQKENPVKLLPAPQMLFEVIQDIKKATASYIKSLIERIEAVPSPEISPDIKEKADRIKTENLIIQIRPSSPVFHAINPHQSLTVYLSKVGTPKDPAIPLTTISPTTKQNRLKKPGALLLEVMKAVDTHLAIQHLKINGLDKFRYRIISNLDNRYNSLNLDAKCPFAPPGKNYHYLDVSNVRTIPISISSDGCISINNMHIGLKAEDGSIWPMADMTPNRKNLILFAEQDTQHPEILVIFSEDKASGTWLNIKKVYSVNPPLLITFPTISEALAQ